MKDGRVVESGPAERILEAPGEPYTRELVAAAFLGGAERGAAVGG